MNTDQTFHCESTSLSWNNRCQQSNLKTMNDLAVSDESSELPLDSAVASLRQSADRSCMREPIDSSAVASFLSDEFMNSNSLGISPKLGDITLFGLLFYFNRRQTSSSTLRARMFGENLDT